LAAGVEPLDRSGRIAGSTVPGGVVPDLVLPPVGQEDDRPPAELALERIGVELCLAGAGGGVSAGALGLDEAERCPVLSPQHVVDPAGAGLVGAGQDGQTVHGVLAILGVLQRPSRIAQQLVDEVGAGLGLAVVVGVRGGVRCSGLADPLAQLLELPLLDGEALVALGDRLAGILLLLGEACGELPDLGRPERCAPGGDLDVEGGLQRGGLGEGGGVLDLQTTTSKRSRSTAMLSCAEILRLPCTASLPRRRSRFSWLLIRAVRFLNCASFIRALRSAR